MAGEDRPQGCFANGGLIVTVTFIKGKIMLKNTSGDIQGLFLSGRTLKWIYCLTDGFFTPHILQFQVHLKRKS